MHLRDSDFDHYRPVTIAQRGVSETGYVSPDGMAVLNEIIEAQQRYMEAVWTGATDFWEATHGEIKHVTMKMRAQLRRTALYARNTGRPVPLFAGVLFPKGDWRPIVGGVLVARRDVPILIPRPVSSTTFTNHAIRVQSWLTTG